MRQIAKSCITLKVHLNKMNTSASEAGFDNERAYALHDPRGVVGVKKFPRRFNKCQLQE